MAGFTKIHIDTSIPLADDPIGKQLDPRLVAERGATLCFAAEETFQKVKKLGLANKSLVYVIGTEVPTPGDFARSQLEETNKPDY